MRLTYSLKQPPTTAAVGTARDYGDRVFRGFVILMAFVAAWTTSSCSTSDSCSAPRAAYQRHVAAVRDAGQARERDLSVMASTSPPPSTGGSISGYDQYYQCLAQAGDNLDLKRLCSPKIKPGSTPSISPEYQSAATDAAEKAKIQTQQATLGYQVVIDSASCFAPDVVASAHQALGK